MKASNFISGFLTGAVAGLTAGLLLAPDKGTETRRKIKEKANDWTDAVKNKFSKTGTEEGEEMLDEAGNKIKEWDRKGKNKMKEGKEKIDDLQEKANNAFS